ncbi:uncharacterized protein EAF02_006808 [Botrytis sinoallii]|uniref:uncharacterized protein n=1 Tax=Botrytis sinoallii TaxID=1463999 RepID=UPI001902B466|nr:uncharacterized protein EAF02_006808 [Botrytis sinoallii]KAF7880917.1 hypothetical protein EAF02_006808 [Botrytis sinoallii]
MFFAASIEQHFRQQRPSGSTSSPRRKVIYAKHGLPSSYSRSNIETRCLQLPQLQVPSPQAVALAHFVMSLWKFNSKSRSQFEYYSALPCRYDLGAPLTNGPTTIRSSYQ